VTGTGRLPRRLRSTANVQRSSNARRTPHVRSALVFLASTAVVALVGAVASYVVPAMLSDEPAAPEVLVHVESNTKRSTGFQDVGTSVAVPIGQGPEAPTSCLDVEDWARKVGGYDLGDSHIEVIVQGNSDQPVLLTGMRAVPVQTEAPVVPQLRSYVCGTPEGEVSPRTLEIDLDSPDRRARSRDVPGARPFFGVTLAKGETELFDVTVSAHRVPTRWHLVLEAVVAGEHREIRVQDGTRPFSTALDPKGPHLRLQEADGGGRWVRCASYESCETGSG
jgi:hypothetical protein